MKKKLLLVLASLMCISLCACGSQNTSNSKPTEPTEVTELTDEELASCYAVQMVKCYVNRPDTLIFNNISVTPYSEEIKYCVKISYTIDTDSQGRSDNFTTYVCIDLNDEDKIVPEYSLKISIYGVDEATGYAESFYNSAKETIIDVDKIVNNMDKFIEIKEESILDPARWGH